MTFSLQSVLELGPLVIGLFGLVFLLFKRMQQPKTNQATNA